MLWLESMYCLLGQGCFAGLEAHESSLIGVRDVWHLKSLLQLHRDLSASILLPHIPTGVFFLCRQFFERIYQYASNALHSAYQSIWLILRQPYP